MARKYIADLLQPYYSDEAITIFFKKSAYNTEV